MTGRVSTAERSALRPHLDQELSMRFGHVQVVVEHGDRGDHIVDVVGSCLLTPTAGHEGTNS